MGSYYIKKEYRNHPVIKINWLDKFPYHDWFFNSIIEIIENPNTDHYSKSGLEGEISDWLSNNDYTYCDRCHYWDKDDSSHWGCRYDEMEVREHDYDDLCWECFDEMEKMD